MDSSKEHSREYQRQAIDAEIKSLEDSIRALRYRRNAVAPISSLPTEVIISIFSILHLSCPPLRASGKRDHLARLCVTHVCHQWREIALNNPLFWSHVDFTNITSAGVAEMLVRAKKAPLHLEVRTTGHQQDNARFSAFKEEIQSRVSYIRHLHISADPAQAVLLYRTLEQLASPAPTLEYLSLSMDANYRFRSPSPASIPDTLFGGTTPRLSYLKLYQYNISWRSPLLKGLRHLEIRLPTEHVSLVDWLNALDEMPQLKKLILHSASPIAPPFPLDVQRTVTLSFLTYLDISASVGDCALALSHLTLPTLTQLCIEAKSVLPNGGDVLKLLPYVTRHSHGPQDTQPLHNVAIRGEKESMKLYAWSGIYSEASAYPFFLVTTPFAPRVALSVRCKDWFLNTHIELLSAAMGAFPLYNLMKLTTELDNARLDEVFWCNHTPQWPLLKSVRLAPLATLGFTEMILQDDGGHENPLLPSLTNLTLSLNTLTMPRALRLCDALMKRVEQGVPVEELDLHTCDTTSNAVQLLSEIVASVCSPGSLFLHPFLPDADFEDDLDGYFESEPYRSDDEEEEEEWEMDDEGEGEEDYLVMWEG